MVTHNPNLTTYASRVITMLDGKIDTDSHEQVKTEKLKVKRSKQRKIKKKLSVKLKRKKK
jgi:ABC-type bacteriocin/lantibiotic exporter with double-glycine peptidase domain